MPSLKELSIALGLLTSDHNPVAVADGWEGYVWRVRAATDCLSEENGFCQMVRDRWDWKRPQHYAFAFATDAKSNTITSRITLQNEDPTDSDQVCIVASFVDGRGQEVAVVYVNWRSLAGRSVTRDAPVRPTVPVSSIAAVAVGTKQCDAKAEADARNFARLRRQLGQR